MESPHSSTKLDLYSIPVFLLEVIILIGLAFSAHFIHFQYKHEPYLTGFYCDDSSLRNEFRETKLTEQFSRPDNELVVLSLLLVVPIVVIIFCELVNSMFGALKFRKIRALCKCCKLHSITRRTIRFSGAYLLGFLIVMISCDILANTTGKFKPYFAQECPNAFKSCLVRNQPNEGLSSPLSPPPNFINPSNLSAEPTTSNQSGFLPVVTPAASTASTSGNQDSLPEFSVRPPSAPISSGQPFGNANPLPTASRLTRSRRDTFVASQSSDRRALERQWVLLDGVDLKRLCEFSGDEIQTRKFDQLAMSWPSFPAAMVTYACLFLASYLSFVGTARPVRIITSVLVVVLLLLAVIFDVQLVREHYSHWEDSLSGALLASFVVVFVLLVYLNKFKDAHYYENQKVPSLMGSTMKRSRFHASQEAQNMSNGYSNEIALEQYSLGKPDDESPASVTNIHQQNNTGDNAGSVPNNDLAMRYFQIPRANYRGAPRPLSSSTNNHL